MNDSLNVAVIGVGALGRHHARILSQMEGVQLVAVAEPNEQQGRSVAEACNCEWTNDFRTLLKTVDAVSIVVPTVMHRTIGEAFLTNSVPVLMEKPLTASVSDGELLVRLAEEHNVPLQVGHIERFNPAFEQLSGWTDEPKYIRTERISPYAFRSMDIGVVLDLMIHDIELCLSLTQEMPISVDAFGLSLVGGHEDVVQARLTFPNGCLADLTVNRVAPEAKRTIQCWSQRGCAITDLTARTTQTYSPSEQMQNGQLPFELARTGQETVESLKPKVFSEFIQADELAAGDADALTAELSSFVDAVRNRTQPKVSGRHALAALRVAETVLECVQQHEWDGVQDGRIGPNALLASYLGEAGFDSAAA